MSKRGLFIRIEEKIYQELWNYIKNTYPESTYGALSAEVQQAIAHWLKLKHAQIHTKPINPGTPRIHQICTQLIQSLKDSGFINQVSRNVLAKTIAETRGSDERTIRKWIKLLVQHGYLKVAGTYIYEIL